MIRTDWEGYDLMYLVIAVLCVLAAALLIAVLKAKNLRITPDMQAQEDTEQMREVSRDRNGGGGPGSQLRLL